MLLTDLDAIERIAEVLGATYGVAPFEVPPLPESSESLSAGRRSLPASEKGEPVYQMSLKSEELGRPLLIILWPSLARVDVRLGESSWTLRGVSEVELYPGVEVLFRRQEPPAFLFVSVQGRVALVA